MRKVEQAREEMVTDVNDQKLCDGVEVRRWEEYFEQVKNVDVREANINLFGDKWLLVLAALNEREILKVEIREAVN